MLSYVVIPHQGDFRDLLIFNSVVSGSVLQQADQQGHRMTPLQTLMHHESHFAPAETPFEHQKSELQHPENFNLVRAALVLNHLQRFIAPEASPLALSYNLDRPQYPNPPPGPKIAAIHIPTTILLI